MKKSLYFATALLLGLGFTACQEDYENVSEHNKIYSTASDAVSTILLDGEADEITRSMQVRIAFPIATEVNVEFGVNEEGVKDYNELYNQNAVVLPAENWTMTQSSATIAPNAITSTEATITFTGVTELDDKDVYVLPVTVKTANVDLLPGKTTWYYVFRGAALINYVANLSENNLSLASGAPGLNGITQLTCEALIYPFSDFGDGREAGISTWLGIEGNFLLRFGDSGVDPLQLQLAASPNVTDSQWKIEKEKWQFITFTYDASNGQCQFFIDGVQKGETKSSSNSKTVNWNASDFYIGKSWSDNRWFGGYMSECRVWNRILTKDELNVRNHFYKVSPDSEGLVAYWKMNEGGGNAVHDYANGYNLNAAADLKWAPVALP